MEKAKPDDAIYRAIETEQGPRMLPSALAGGPWNPEHQHGGPVAGLLTRALHGIESPVPMRLVRITTEMFRGVPLRPLRVDTRIVRGGKRIQSVEANVFDDDRLVARATGLRIRIDESLAPLAAGEDRIEAIGTRPAAPVAPARESGALPVLATGPMPGFIHAVDIDVEKPTETGLPARVWSRLRCRFSEGEPTPPIVRLATLVDFTSGTGNVLDDRRYSSINPDLSIHVHREPRSEWIGIRAVTIRGSDGIGLSSGDLFDLEGPIGRAQVSLLLDRR
jgi:hypothetical protein